MGNRLIKNVFFVLLNIFLFINCFLVNIVIHEVGHYIAADYYNLEPRIEFELGNMTGAGFGFESVPLAYTSFIDNGDDGEISVIALVGPFFNLILGLVCLFLFIFIKDKYYLKEFLLIMMIVCFGSFIMNLIPLEGSDGSLIFR